MPFTLEATGGTITDITVSGKQYRVHTFTTSGTFTVTAGSGPVEYLIVGGGSGGSYNNWYGVAGSGGGVVEGTVTVSGPVGYTIIVGLGGAALGVGPYNTGNDGQPSSAFGFTAGGGDTTGLNNSVSGAPQSNASDGSGGGAGGPATALNSPGPGYASSITGVEVRYAGGGGGGDTGNLGADGGGAAANTGLRGGDGTPNRGGGGGSGAATRAQGSGAGGSGVVILRYSELESSLTSNKASVNVNETFTVTLFDLYAANGTQFSYFISGVTSQEINLAPLTGNFTINNSTASITFTSKSRTYKNFTITSNGLTLSVEFLRSSNVIYDSLETVAVVKQIAINRAELAVEDYPIEFTGNETQIVTNSTVPLKFIEAKTEATVFGDYNIFEYSVSAYPSSDINVNTNSKENQPLSFTTEKTVPIFGITGSEIVPFVTSKDISVSYDWLNYPVIANDELGDSTTSEINFGVQTVYGIRVGVLGNTDVQYTTPGTYNWIAPAGVTSVSVVCVGGGGAGDDGNSGDGGGGGGGGGALAYANNITVIPGVSYTVVVGAGGSNGNGKNARAQSGGLSSFTVGSFVMTANGGEGGAPYSTTPGASGGTFSFVNTPGGVTTGGGNGGGGGASYDGGGGGGGAGGGGGNGGNGSGSITGREFTSGFNGVGTGAGGGGGAAFSAGTGNSGGGNGGTGQSNVTGGGGGGSNIFGSTGATNGGNGNGLASAGSKGGDGGAPGGGGGGSWDNNTGVVALGGNGAVRIIAGGGRSFPDNAEISTSANIPGPTTSYTDVIYNSYESPYIATVVEKAIYVELTDTSVSYFTNYEPTFTVTSDKTVYTEKNLSLNSGHVTLSTEKSIGVYQDRDSIEQQIASKDVMTTLNDLTYNLIKIVPTNISISVRDDQELGFFIDANGNSSFAVLTDANDPRAVQVPGVTPRQIWY